MTFTSLIFPLFLLLVTLGFYVVPRKIRWVLLLLASCYFYMAFVPKYVLILFALILVDFTMALLIERSQGHRRRLFFIVSITASVGLLFVFKYFNFFNENVASLAHFLGWNYSIAALRLILPLGLSFHTFQSLSYVIEVYRGKYPATRDLGTYALYVMFFPQLVAGPIERPQHLLEELKHISAVRFDWSRTLSGLRLIAWGFFKKLVIADRLSLSVDYVYAHIASLPGPSILIAAIFFAFQLYTDFSAYSDIARGTARLFGIDIIRNFDRPYFSASMSEFWRRWHISLSSWFRDYIYIPLGGNRVGVSRQILNILTVFLVSGLWHGAGWTFIIMGLLFGTYIALGIITQPLRNWVVRSIGLDRVPRAHRIVQQLYTFALACFAWVFFRAPDLSTALTFLRQLFTGWHMSLLEYVHQYAILPFSTLGVGRPDIEVSVGGIIALLIIEYITIRHSLAEILDRKPLFWKVFAYVGLVLTIILFGEFTTKQFIYFQF